MPGSTALTQARDAYDARQWTRAREGFAAAAALSPEDLDRYAVTLMMLGDMEGYFAIREQAHDERLAAGDLVGAAMAAFWAGMQRVVAGDVAAGSGWLARAGRLVAEDGTDSVPAGFLTLAGSFDALARGDAEAAASLAQQGVDAGRRLGSPDLLGLALHQLGLVLLAAGRPDEGLAALDEAMIDVSSGKLSPMVTGIVYCGVIQGCWSSYELDRAQRWTAAMSDWCRSQADLGNFTGECLVRRAELKQLQGEWAGAHADLRAIEAREQDSWTAGTAAYLRGNLDRLQGAFDDAEEAFAEAARFGCDPQPGLALLRLARGNVQAAAAMVRRCLAESLDDGKRVEVLAAASEVFLVVEEIEAAQAAVAELDVLAGRCRAPVVRGLADQAAAAVQLALGHPEAALPPAREALRRWVAAPAPYQEARTRLLLAEACRALGDDESATRETATARDLLAGLGAAPDLARLPGERSLLSPREVEVLRLVATGATNRSIATQLVLSERTVDRHVSNILGKLGVASRAAATAYAFEHRLVGGTHRAPAQDG